ncbi:MAG: toxin-antitoxin system HicB family antitoxin, partial [Dehalococcoidales bacterium]|nr:toxin-antitoxin system HicB family antitoxin [Dehalococcoidales bacterium]
MSTVKTALDYEVTLRFKEGNWISEILDLPGAIIQGRTASTAVRKCLDVAEDWIESAQEDGVQIPEPFDSSIGKFSGKFVLRVPRSLHRQLAMRARAEGVSMNQLCSVLLQKALSEEKTFNATHVWFSNPPTSLQLGAGENLEPTDRLGLTRGSVESTDFVHLVSRFCTTNRLGAYSRV